MIKNKSAIALITLSCLIFIVSLWLLISWASYLAYMVGSYPVPVDSFGTIEKGIAAVIIFSVLVIASIVGIILGVLKLKKQYNK